MQTRISTTTIDMFTPAEACRELALDETMLIDMVNQGHLPAYDFGGEIRFKVADVVAALAMLVVA